MSYTENPSHPPGIVFPNQGMQTLSSVIYLTGCSVLAFCIASRTKNLFSWDTWVEMSWPRLCTLLVFADSWLFLFSTGILIGGAGMSSSFVTCALGIYACLSLYAFTKVLIYCFLIEKVHIVWGGAHQPRLKSKVYRLCLITMTPYAVILVLMILGRVAYFRSDRACIIGLRKFASLPLLIYDLYINLFLTGMFLWPLFRSRLANLRIRRMAMRTLFAAGAALTTSTINIAVLTIMHGQQLGWVCLGSCGTDVMINALVLFWVTDNGSSSVENTPATGGTPAPTNGGSHGIPGVTSHQSFATTPRGRPSGGTGGVVLSKDCQDKSHSGTASRAVSIFGKIGGALKGKNDDETRTDQMSVQVDIMMNDVKYVPSAESVNESVGASAQEASDVEKGLAPPQV